jgi:hypothetical protein
MPFRTNSNAPYSNESDHVGEDQFGSVAGLDDFPGKTLSAKLFI